MEQVQKTKTASSNDVEVTDLPAPVETTDIDDLIDEIDSVLEENAEQFVRDYRQAGGE